MTIAAEYEVSKMDKKLTKTIAASTVLLLLLLICFLLNFKTRDNNNKPPSMDLLAPEAEVQEDEPKEPSPPPTIIDIVKSMFSLPTTLLPVPAGAANYWISMNLVNKLCLIIKQGRSYFSPPNIDFRDSPKDESAEAITREVTTGEKVKEAIAKSLDNNKVTMEESAKSAAKYAGEAMQKTADKVKTTLLSHGGGTTGADSQSQAEL